MKDKFAEERQAYLQLHACVILWGFTAILGRIISLPAVQLVYLRMALVAVVLLAVHRTWIGVAGMPRRSIFLFVSFLLGKELLIFGPKNHLTKIIVIICLIFIYVDPYNQWKKFLVSKF